MSRSTVLSLPLELVFPGLVYAALLCFTLLYCSRLFYALLGNAMLG
jgi:hypothetical protein